MINEDTMPNFQDQPLGSPLSDKPMRKCFDLSTLQLNLL